MDKTDIALAGVEENAALIRSLQRSSSVTVLSGRAQVINDAAVTYFGRFRIKDNAAIVVTFSDGAGTLAFAGRTVAFGSYAVSGTLKAGEGELTLSGAHGNAAAIIIGGVKKI